MICLQVPLNDDDDDDDSTIQFSLKSICIWNSYNQKNKGVRFFWNAVNIVYVAYFRYKGKFIGNRYGPGTGTIWLHTTRCIGNEISIAHCYHRIKADHCNHSQDVSVSCGTSPVHFGKDIN